MKTNFKKILFRLAVLPAVWIINFSLLYFSPGDATSRYWGPQTSQSALAQMRVEKGLDLAYPEQLLFWTNRLLQGDLGYSWTYHRPVLAVFADVLPATLQLTTAALVLNILLGSFLGVVSAVFAGRPGGKLLDYLGQTIYAVPLFLFAMTLIYIFSIKLQWTPVSGLQSILMPGDSALLDRMHHLALPVAALGLAGAVPIMRYVSANMKEILREPYIVLARAKGLSKARTVLTHAFRNSLLPIITQVGLALPILFSGALVVEVIFALPGMGRAIYEAIFAKDYPVILAANFITAVLIIFGNLAADAVYGLVDPKTKH